MAYIGWLLAGVLLAGLAAGLLTPRRKTLPERMRKVAVYRGLTYWEVLQIAQAAPTSVQPLPGGKTLRSWTDGDYRITLRFDRGDLCLGVEEERDE